MTLSIRKIGGFSRGQSLSTTSIMTVTSTKASKAFVPCLTWKGSGMKHAETWVWAVEGDKRLRNFKTTLRWEGALGGCKLQYVIIKLKAHTSILPLGMAALTRRAHCNSRLSHDPTSNFLQSRLNSGKEVVRVQTTSSISLPLFCRCASRPCSPQLRLP